MCVCVCVCVCLYVLININRFRYTNFAFSITCVIIQIYNVNNKTHKFRQNYSKVSTRKLLHVSSLAGPSSGTAKIMGQQASKLVWVWVLKHYCNCKEVCAISWSPCNSWITHLTLSVKSQNLYISSFKRDFRLPPLSSWELRSSGFYVARSGNFLPTFR